MNVASHTAEKGLVVLTESLPWLQEKVVMRSLIA